VKLDWSLDGKVAIVTGAAKGGIGEAHANALAGAGAAVVCADVDVGRARAVADGIDAQGGKGLTGGGRHR
jgi:3-oxoacyl-[acyl-carrier protein] reductase